MKAIAIFLFGFLPFAAVPSLAQVTLDEAAAAVDNSPNDAELRYLYGSLLLEHNERDAALVQLRTAVAMGPENGDARYNLAATYVAKAMMEATGAEQQEMIAKAVLHLKKAWMLCGTVEEGAKKTTVCRTALQLRSRFRLGDALIAECGSGRE